MKKFFSSLGRFTTKLVSLLVICGLISLACLPMVRAAEGDEEVDYGDCVTTVATITEEDETKGEIKDGDETPEDDDPVPTTYTITIQHCDVDSNKKIAADKIVYNHPADTAYHLAPEDFSGYEALEKQEQITAKINEDTLFTLHYKKIPAPISKVALTIEYKYEDGTEAAKTHTEEVEVGEGYEVTSPVIEGYTADKDVVKGTMSKDDVEDGVNVTVTYTKNTPDQPDPVKYTVTIKYQDIAGEKIADDDVEVEKYTAGEHTFIPKAIEGYITPSSKTVTVAEDNNTVVIFNYRKSTDTLTIHYLYADGKTAADDYVQDVRIGTTYTVESPSIANYTPDQPTVTGEMVAGGATHIVTYNQNPPEVPTEYTITIHYQNEDKEEIAPSTTEVRTAGEHTFKPKEIDGYIKPADQTINVAVDTSITFTYKKAPASNPEQPGDKPGDDEPGGDEPGEDDPKNPTNPTNPDQPTDDKPTDQKPSTQGPTTLPTAGPSDELIRDFLILDAEVSAGGLGLWAVSGVIRKIRRR